MTPLKSLVWQGDPGMCGFYMSLLLRHFLFIYQDTVCIKKVDKGKQYICKHKEKMVNYDSCIRGEHIHTLAMSSCCFFTDPTEMLTFNAPYVCSTSF